VTPGADTELSRGATGGHPRGWQDDGRLALCLTSAVLLVVCLVPPVGTWSRRYEFVEALQFSILAVVVPALAVLGAPWRRVGLAIRPAPPYDDDEGWAADPSALGPIDRLALGRRSHPEALRSAGFAVLFLGAAVVWRIPATVDALARHPWLVAVEAVSLIGLSGGLWLELVESPPLTPRLSRPSRVALAAVVMWAIWILAYLVGLSHASWYHAYSHHAGSGLSLSADQQLTTGVMWFVSGCAFVPVVFWNLIRWLQAEEDPDEEMHRLVRTERIRGRTVDGGSPVA
jgi:cytochrome c oxidase assembly factor CtaG